MIIPPRDEALRALALCPCCGQPWPQRYAREPWASSVPVAPRLDAKCGLPPRYFTDCRRPYGLEFKVIVRRKKPKRTKKAQ